MENVKANLVKSTIKTILLLSGTMLMFIGCSAALCETIRIFMISLFDGTIEYFRFLDIKWYVQAICHNNWYILSIISIITGSMLRTLGKK